MSEYKSVINTLNKRSFDKNISESIDSSRKVNPTNNSFSTSSKIQNPSHEKESFVTLNNGMVFNDENLADNSQKKKTIEEIISSGVKKNVSTIKPQKFKQSDFQKETFITKDTSSEAILQQIFNNPSQRIPSCYRYTHKYETH